MWAAGSTTTRRCCCSVCRRPPERPSPARRSTPGAWGRAHRRSDGAWNTLEVLGLGAGDVDRPVNAIPGRARAVLQLRYVVGTDVGKAAEAVAEHLAEHGFPMVDVRLLGSFAASRTPLDDPWARWARTTLEQVAGRPVAVLPNIGGSLPNAVFTDVLGLPTLWLPHSYPGCLQHAPDEYLLASIAREGLVLATGFFHTLGHPPAGHPLPTRP